MIAAAGPEALGALRSAAPAGVEVRALPADPGSIEGLDGVEFLVVTGDELAARLGELERLRVVQVLSAGTDWIEPHLPAGVTLCNARGARDVAVAEWVVAVLLAVAQRLPEALAAQAQGRWERYEPGELAGSRVLILGQGSIGRAVRRRLEALRVDVVGVGRRERPTVRSMEALPGLLGEMDAVVVLLPLTGETRGLVDAAFLARMRDGALLVNAGRGPVVDTAALTREVAAGRLRAALDVVEPEPLPAAHELWHLPGVLLTPHVAGDTRPAEERAARLAGDQLARWARGEPLRNVVRAG